MRAPRRKRPLQRRLIEDSAADWPTMLKPVSYVGSPEHKDTPSFAGHPRPRADASICSRSLARDQLTVNQWLQTAVQAGNYSAFFEGDFPRYVWYRDEPSGITYEARLVNREQGCYKGYPLNESEVPAGLRHISHEHS